MTPAPARDWVWDIARAFAALRRFVHRTTGIHVKGLGYILRHLRADHEFESGGYRWFIDRRIARPYAGLMSGASHEPETFLFLERIVTGLNGPFEIVDVGANIGEMIVPLAAHPGCVSAIAYEPHPVCAQVLTRQFTLNDLQRAQVRQAVVGDGTAQRYWVNESSAPESGIRPDMTGIPLASTVRLDDELEAGRPCIILIDVEGGELDVMKGARMFIAAQRPLLIFEYHALTRQRFSLEEVRDVLDRAYELFRLRHDGRLDRDLDDTYNCVAVHRDSEFYPLAQASVT